MIPEKGVAALGFKLKFLNLISQKYDHWLQILIRKHIYFSFKINNMYIKGNRIFKFMPQMS